MTILRIFLLWFVLDLNAFIPSFMENFCDNLAYRMNFKKVCRWNVIRLNIIVPLTVIRNLKSKCKWVILVINKNRFLIDALVNGLVLKRTDVTCFSSFGCNQQVISYSNSVMVACTMHYHIYAGDLVHDPFLELLGYSCTWKFINIYIELIDEFSRHALKLRNCEKFSDSNCFKMLRVMDP